MNHSASEMGIEPIGKLLIKHALPSSMGILVMSLNILIDTILVGHWIGPNAIAAINIVLPVSFFVAAIGMSIGIGGGSIISRSLGNKNHDKANKTFGNQVSLTLISTIFFMSIGLYFTDTLIPLFGGKGELFDLAKIYYVIVMVGVPILGLCMMSNNTIRSEGKPKIAMYAMFIPSVSNLCLDYLFIYELGLGMYGAALATTLSYFICGIYILRFFLLKKSDLKLNINDLKFDIRIVKETVSLGFVTLSRQAAVSLTVLVVNNILFSLQGESMIAVYAIISRMLMFMLFPILGITQGFIPIAGYNFGAKNIDRVLNSVKKAIIYSTGMATVIFLFIYTFSDSVANAFTSDVNIINKTSDALILVFMATPIIGIQLIGSAYFQAIGRAFPALMLTLSRQVFFLIPLVFFLSKIYGVYGVWISFPLAELLSTVLTGIYLNSEIKKLIITT